MPLTRVPEIGEPAQQRALELVNHPERFDANDLTVGLPCAGLLQPALRTGGPANFEKVAAPEDIEPSGVDRLAAGPAG